MLMLAQLSPGLGLLPVLAWSIVLGCSAGTDIRVTPPVVNDLGDGGQFANEVSSSPPLQPQPAQAAAVAALEAACDSGDAEACVKASSAYSKGEEGVERDRDRMMELEERGCELGSGRACHYMANNFVCAENNLQKFLAYRKRACTLSYTQACADLAIRSRTGACGLEVNLDDSREYFMKACAAGDESMCGSFEAWMDKPVRVRRTGGMDKNVIRQVVRSHIADVRTCYNTGLGKDPKLAGRVTINFVIGPNGTVDRSVVDSSELSGELGREVSACIAAVVEQWKFPSPRGGGNVIVTYPFHLNPG